MSYAALASVHSIQVLLQAVQMSGSMVPQRTFTVARTLACRVVPKPGNVDTQQGQRGAVIPHDIYFASDPQLSLNERVAWTVGSGAGATTTIMRITREASAGGEHGLQTMWIVGAEARSEDNEGSLEIA